LTEPQQVDLTVEKADWFVLLDDPVKRIDLKPGEVRSTEFRLRATRVGKHHLQVTARGHGFPPRPSPVPKGTPPGGEGGVRGSGLADAIKREVEVEPDGRRVEQVVNGNLLHPSELVLTV